MKLKQMLTAKAVDSLSKPGKYGDQHGLMLLVRQGTQQVLGLAGHRQRDGKTGGQGARCLALYDPG